MRKYHDRMIALLALAAIAAVVAGSLMTIDALRAETRLEVARAQARYEAAQAQVDKLAARELLPEGMGEPVPLGDYLVTAYCCEEYPHICGGNGVTATGTKPTPGITAAADWGQLPPGSVIYIVGVGIRVIEDSGSAVTGNVLDVAVATHAEALSWPGYGHHEVWLLQRGGEDQ